MKTTLDLSGTVLRQAKARAALKGQSLKAYVSEALRDKLAQESAASKNRQGWRSVFGKAPKGSTAELQGVLDVEFSRIDPEES